MRKNCSSDREKLLKFEAAGKGGLDTYPSHLSEGQEFAKILRSLEQFIQTVKVRKFK